MSIIFFDIDGTVMDLDGTIPPLRRDGGAAAAPGGAPLRHQHRAAQACHGPAAYGHGF